MKPPLVEGRKSDLASGDGVATARFRSERDAKAFAAGKRYYSAPAEATRTEAPRKVAQRWGLA